MSVELDHSVPRVHDEAPTALVKSHEAYTDAQTRLGEVRVDRDRAVWKGLNRPFAGCETQPEHPGYA